MRGSSFLVLGSAFTVRGSAFGVRGSSFAVRRSPFGVRGSSFAVAAFVAALLVGSWFVPATAQQEFAARAAAPLTLLQINDVYTTVPIDGQGGLARVATLKQNLAKAGHTPFLVIAGDFLSPSVASSVFRGEHMVAALNAAGLDLATLGNHEFDFGDDVLIQRMHEATFQWVVSNVVDTVTGQPIGGAAPFVVKTFGALKVGFLGLCLNTSEITADKLKHTRISDPLAAAGRYLPLIKQAGATVIVAVTHLAFADDRALVEQYPDIDVVIGGHEHYLITAAERRSFISKAGSDAKFVARIDLNQRLSGTIERFYELVPITGALADDPKTAAAIASFESRLSTALETVAGTTSVPLDGLALHLRTAETNLGDLVADAIRADAHADIAITNGGSIRGNRLFPAGPLTRRTLVEIHPFDNVICVLALPGRAVLAALNHGVSSLPAADGRFPQVSGLTMSVDHSAPVGSRVRDVTVNGQPLDPNKTYTVAIPDFILKQGDGYTMFTGQPLRVAPEAGNLISTALERYVTATQHLEPAAEPRITIR
jgi:2',3'-cyclic-nucleotide 2'-phosphodiesterase (5'-nucleotidase family)